ncbi:hypothetical protein, partial [Anaerotruncus colihominis]|uniref:hypothetical protein n=1 Tax=Anaerotruncus colihominis TaxID=169435 RepID=UPI0029436C5E
YVSYTFWSIASLLPKNFAFEVLPYYTAKSMPNILIYTKNNKVFLCRPTFPYFIKTRLPIFPVFCF